MLNKFIRASIFSKLEKTLTEHLVSRSLRKTAAINFNDNFFPLWSSISGTIGVFEAFIYGYDDDDDEDYDDDDDDDDTTTTIMMMIMNMPHHPGHLQFLNLPDFKKFLA